MHIHNRGIVWFVGSTFACFLVLLSCTTTSSPSPQASVDLFEMVARGDLDTLKTRFGKDSVNVRDANGDTLLHVGVLRNDAHVVDFLLSMGADTEAQDASGSTPLMVAVTENCFESVRMLIARDASLFSRDAQGDTPLTRAIRKGTEHELVTRKTLLQKDKSGKTPWHWAVRALDRDLIKHLVTLGPPTQERDADGHTPLSLAYSSSSDARAAEVAADLLLGGAELMHGSFSEFEIAVLKRNYDLHFTDGSTPLHVMAKRGYTGFVQFLVDRKVNLNAKNLSSATPLHEAVRAGQVDAAVLLLRSGADPNVRDASGNTCLHLVAPAPFRVRLVGALLDAGASVAIKDDYGETPLHVAARLGMDRAFVERLVGAGADISERNKKGETPLVLTIDRDHRDLTAYFVSLGADIHAEDMRGETPLTKALARGLETVKIVVTDSNLYKQDVVGRDPLHVAVSRRAHLDIVKFLFREPKQMIARDTMGNTLLHYAVANDDRAVGEFLMREGADIFSTNVHGVSPLKTALTTSGGREDWILTAANVHAQDTGGNTPLHLACEWKLTQAINGILRKGAEIEARNLNQETPLFSAVKSDAAEVISILLHPQAGNPALVDARDAVGNTVLHACVRWSALRSADVLIREADARHVSLLNARNLSGKPPLHLAARAGNVDFIRLLLSHRVALHMGDETGKSALTDAVLADQEESVHMLLSAGANPVQQDMYGRTPLHEAVLCNSQSVIAALRAAGGNPFARDSYGTTPLSLALLKGDTFVGAVVGKDPLLANSDGQTPLHLAVMENVPVQTFRLLLAKGYPIDKRDRMGSSALVLAIKKDRSDLCHELLALGADLFIANNVGESPALLVLSKNTSILKTLVGFAVNKTDSAGESILHYAAKVADEKTLQGLLAMNRFGKFLRNVAGETPYDVAVRWSRPKIAALLKE